MDIVIGIVSNLIVGAILLALFMWRRPGVVGRVGDAAAALKLIREAIPEAAGRLALSDDGDAALLIGADAGMTCLLQRHGHRCNVRRLHAGEVATAVELDGLIRLRLRDFGWPACRLRISDPQLRYECFERLSELSTLAPATSATVGSHA